MSVLSAFLSLSVPLKLGLLLSTFAFLMAFYKTFIYILSKKTQGTIVDFASGRGNKGGTIYYPVFKYTAEDGQEVTAQGTVGSNPPGFSVGQQVPIYYIRFAPQRAKIAKLGDMFFAEFMLGFFGLLLLCVGILDLLGVLEFLDRIGLINLNR